MSGNGSRDAGMAGPWGHRCMDGYKHVSSYQVTLQNGHVLCKARIVLVCWTGLPILGLVAGLTEAKPGEHQERPNRRSTHITRRWYGPGDQVSYEIFARLSVLAVFIPTRWVKSTAGSLSQPQDRLFDATKRGSSHLQCTLGVAILSAIKPRMRVNLRTCPELFLPSNRTFRPAFIIAKARVRRNKGSFIIRV